MNDISALDFRQRWPEWADQFVRFPADTLSSFDLADEDRALLDDPGLPPFAAPHMHFFFEGAQLPEPTDEFGQLLANTPPGLRMIGITAEGWPICFWAGHNGQVVCVESTAPFAIHFLNSTVRQLAASLLRYSEMIERALTYGEARGEADAWRRNRYPDEMRLELRAQLEAIDPEAFGNGAYWSMHFERV